MNNRLQDELQELAEYRASGLTPEEVLKLVRFLRKTVKEWEEQKK
jgi:hypothetical protein